MLTLSFFSELGVLGVLAVHQKKYFHNSDRIAIKEVGSGLNDNRKLLTNALQDKDYNILIAEHRDRVTRFGLNYIKLLLSATGKRLEIVNDADNGKDELMQDLVSVITSFVQRIYGLRRLEERQRKLSQNYTTIGEKNEISRASCHKNRSSIL